MKALLGGSFDPIHDGHLALAEALLDRFDADDVYLVPAFQNPLKAGAHASADDRRAMVDIALHERKRAHLHCLPWELERTGPSYTVDTLRRFAAEFPGPRALVLGNEVFARFAEWREPEAILALAELWVVARVEAHGQSAAVLTDALAPLGLSVQPVAADRFRAGAQGQLRWLEPKTPHVSSTELRHEMAQTDRSCRHAVPGNLPRGVWEYIKKRSLYAVTEE